MTSPARFRLDGRTAFITGAAGHLGTAMALEFAGAGASVILNGRREGPLSALRKRIATAGGRATIAAFDIMDTDRLKGALAALPRLDVLVNNAYTGRPGTLASMTAEDCERAFASGLTAALEATRAALPALRAAVQAAGSASVINISSMYGLVSPDSRLYDDTGFDSAPWYAATKGGIIQMTRHLACHLAPERIRVNALCPGPFPADTVRTAHPEFVERIAAKVPLGRIGAPDDIAGPALFLASDAANFVTGVVLPVDGGWTAW